MYEMFAVFDRTLTDVQYALENPDYALELKGALNVSDLIRLETNIEIVATLLNDNGYPNDIICKTDWEISDVVTQLDIDSIRSNLLELVNDLKDYVTTDLIVGKNTLDYIELNKMEKLIYDINNIFIKIVLYARFCGTSYCGDNQTL